MVDTKAVSVRLPLDLLNELNSYATDKGMVRGGDANIGGAIIAVLRQHFGEPDNVKQVSDNVDIESIVNIATAKQLNVPIAPLLAKIDSIESTIGSQDDKIAALEAIVIGLPTTFISTEQINAIVDKAIEPLLEALDNTRSEATTPASYTQALTVESEGSSAPDVAESSLEPVPTIEAIANIAALPIEVTAAATAKQTKKQSKSKKALSEIDVEQAYEIAKSRGYGGSIQSFKQDFSRQKEAFGQKYGLERWKKEEGHTKPYSYRDTL